MPVLPALAAIFGVGLQCKITGDPLTGIYSCSDHMTLRGAAMWENGYASLQENVQQDLIKYDSKLGKHLADYSKFCSLPMYNSDKLRGQKERMVHSNFHNLYEVDIAKIFCPHEHNQCHGWKDIECLKTRCSRAQPLYAAISDGIHTMHRACFQAGLDGEGNDITALMEKLRLPVKDLDGN